MQASAFNLRYSTLDGLLYMCQLLNTANLRLHDLGPKSLRHEALCMNTIVHPASVFKQDPCSPGLPEISTVADMVECSWHPPLPWRRVVSSRAGWT